MFNKRQNLKVDKKGMAHLTNIHEKYIQQSTTTTLGSTMTSDFFTDVIINQVKQITKKKVK